MNFSKAIAIAFLLICTPKLPVAGEVFNFFYYNENSCDDDCCNEFLPDSLESSARVYADHVEGRWIDNPEGYSSLGTFIALPLDCCARYLPFIDLRGHVFNDGKYAANLGGGVRFLTHCNDVFGLNVYYDYRETGSHRHHHNAPSNSGESSHSGDSEISHHSDIDVSTPLLMTECRDNQWKHHFQQIGIGAEWLGRCVDFRVNGYIPLGHRVAHGVECFFDYFDKGVESTIPVYEAFCARSRSSAWGIDGEIGRYLMRMSSCTCFDLYAAVGTYYYNPKNACKDFWGAKARLEARIGNYVDLKLIGGYDPIYKGSLQGTITLTVPFDCFRACCCSAFDDCYLRDIAYQPVQRQELIVLGTKNCCWDWTWGDQSSR